MPSPLAGEGTSAFPKAGWVRGLSRRDHLLGGADTGVPAAVRSREVVDRAGFAGEEQPPGDRFGKLRPAIGKARRRIRIGAERKRIDAPAVNADRLDACGKRAAEKTDKIRLGALKKSAVAPGFQLGRKPSAEINLDHRPPERPEMIVRGRGPIGVSKQARVLLEFIGVCEQQE